jgi:hypothetical protein
VLIIAWIVVVGALAWTSSQSSLFGQILAVFVASLFTCVQCAAFGSIVKAPVLDNSKILQMEQERDKLVSKYRGLEAKYREVEETSEIRRQENLRLQSALDYEKEESLRLRQVNQRLRQENGVLEVVGTSPSPADECLDRLWRNFPSNAKYLIGNAHRLDPNIPVTKQGRPDRRYRVGRGFSKFSSEVIYVLHEGKRICIMLETVAET